ncbi:hypothetical protein [Pseudomonas sp. UBA1879]|uniref:hypothetical protein n=1 Tax=Pseudomonas sp. UBA1879 TaxID=1947305 RepID=UPI0025FB6F4E|nr:hypothetical protein [Pseudomonas sp. UBA1879]
MATDKRVIPGCFDEMMEVDTYKAEHRLGGQPSVGRGYPLNPVLREDFINTPNNHREPLEVEDWWGLPYIQSTTWEQAEGQRRRVQMEHRAFGGGVIGELSHEEVEAQIDAHRVSFFEQNPGGTKYTVHCLDGGAWDRPTLWGVFPTLDEAIDCCDLGPAWRRAKLKAPV